VIRSHGDTRSSIIEQRTALRWLGYLYFKNNSTLICRTIGSDHIVGCSCAQTTTIMYLRTVCLRMNLRLNNIFCCLSNFTFLNTLIIRSTNYKSVSGHLWYQVSGRDMSFVQAIYPLSLTDSKVLFTAKVCFPKSFWVLYLLAKTMRE